MFGFFSPDKIENCLSYLCLIRLKTETAMTYVAEPI